MCDLFVLFVFYLNIEHNWGYKTEPEKLACLKLTGGVCNWPKGRALGGTSVINYLVYNRGHKDDFNRWADYGNYGWSYSNVLPYFKKSERIGMDELMSSKYRGHNGYLDVQHPAYRSKLLDAFIDAGYKLGYKENDPNGEDMLGFSQVQATMRNGRRWSAAKAYLRPVANERKNLAISMKSWVKKILIDPETKLAQGVEFVKNKRTYKIKATKEVILSAGAIASPQLLMLSGIGPEDHLKEFSIPVIRNLSVGYNLQDHVGLSGLVFLVNESITLNEQNVQRPSKVLSYLLFGRGPLTVPGGAEGVAFVRTENATTGKRLQFIDISFIQQFLINNSFIAPGYPDIEIVLGSGAVSGDISGTMRNMLGISNEFFNEVYDGIIGDDAFGLVPVIMRPQSRGRIKLKSRSPYQWPKMEPNYFSHREDLETLVRGAKMVSNKLLSYSQNKNGYFQGRKIG